jgi:hypothetical protein
MSSRVACLRFQSSVVALRLSVCETGGLALAYTQLGGTFMSAAIRDNGGRLYNLDPFQIAGLILAVRITSQRLS